MYCVIVQCPTDNHPNKTDARTINQNGERVNGNSFPDINDAYRSAEKYNDNDYWLYTVAECEK